MFIRLATGLTNSGQSLPLFLCPSDSMSKLYTSLGFKLDLSDYNQHDILKRFRSSCHISDHVRVSHQLPVPPQNRSSQSLKGIIRVKYDQRALQWRRWCPIRPSRITKLFLLKNQKLLNIKSVLLFVDWSEPIYYFTSFSKVHRYEAKAKQLNLRFQTDQKEC